MYIRLTSVLSVALFLSTVVLGQQITTIGAKAAPTGMDTIVVTGTVKDAATGKPIDGSRISVQDFSAAISDSLGNFWIKVPFLNAAIFVEADGYNRQIVPVNFRNRIEVLLLADMTHTFDDLLVMPLGQQYQRYTSAAVGQYRGQGWQQPLETIDALLQGQVAGLNAIRRSGAPGAGANLFLNGINSLYATNQPLIVVDGMPFDASEYGQSLIANNYTNPLSLIDVKDIDNVTVLKDAASIYGAKGANGAIIITTVNAGGQQATKIDAGIYAGMNFAPQQLPVLNAVDYRIHLNRMLSSSGMTAEQIAGLPYMIDDLSRTDYFRYHNNTDWQGKVLDNSVNQNVYLRITGGDNIATYGLTVGYMKNSGVIKNTDIERYNTRFNADFNFSERLKGMANLSFTYNDQNVKDQGIADKTAPLFNALVKAPLFHERELAADGTASPNLEAVDILGISNPVAITDKIEAYNKYYRFFGSFKFQYDISKYFTACTMVGIQFDKYRETFYVPSEGIVMDTLWNDIANNRMGSQVKQLFSLFNDTRLEYNRVFNYQHSVKARLGFRFQNNKANQVYVTTANSATDDLVSVQNGLAGLRQVGGDMGEWSWINNYLGAAYGFKDKIFLDLNMALDGSSRFGVKAANGLTIAGHQFPLFPSIGAAWLVSSEKFMSNSAVDLFKLRASYSVAGNDDIGNYAARQLYVGQNLLGAEGSVRKGISNPELQWETVYKINGGIDLAFFHNRLGLSFDVFSNRTKNMLVYRPMESITGFGSVLTNGGELQNNGFEANLNFRVLNGQQLKWDFGANIATYKNKILAVPQDAIYTNYANATIVTAVGQPANQFYGYKTNGVFATDAEAAASGLTKINTDGSVSAFEAGDIRFVDNGDKIIDEDDRTVIGDANPDFFGGVSNRLTWKGFELNALVTFSVGNDVYNYVRYRLESQSGVQNQLQSVMNSWQVEGQQTTMPKAAWGDPMGNNRFSDRWIEDGSYLRLRSLNLTYNFPVKSNGVFKSIAVLLTGNNLFTATKYLGYDPEFSVTSSPLVQGIDTGLTPVSKNVVLGVRLGL
ncbi:SusC/RagA family TonB-linked outer membrane protein [Niabella insulamsoli]|uniref:SusC/RagA family TonB-linked outer membrane protein n=1 Tax=Niabella insulamsoli TaxID=3144874 RepID=UPI0031FD0BEA